MPRYNARHSQIREDRSILLDFVNAAFPRSLRRDQLVEVMMELDPPLSAEYVERDLAYLAARGLIERTVEDHAVLKRKVVRYRMTADGVTFIEREKPWDELEGAER